MPKIIILQYNKRINMFSLVNTILSIHLIPLVKENIPLFIVQLIPVSKNFLSEWLNIDFVPLVISQFPGVPEFQGTYI